MSITTRFTILSLITAVLAVTTVIYAFDKLIIPKQIDFTLGNASSIALHVRRIAPLMPKEQLQAVLESLSAENDSISYIYVLDSDEIAIAHSDRQQIGEEYRGYIELLRGADSEYLYRRTTLEKKGTGEKEPIYEVDMATYGKGGVISGVISLGMSVDYLTSLRREYYSVMTVVLVLVFALLILVNYILYGTIISPIRELANLIQARGFGEQVEFPDSNRKDEIGILLDALRTANVGVRDTIVELKRREDELSEYADNMPDLHAKLAPDGSIIMINKTFIERSGVPTELISGEKFWEAPWCALTMDARLRIQDIVVRIGAGGSTMSLEVELLGLSENRVLDLTLEPVLDEKGKVKYIVAAGRDITERKIQEMEVLYAYMEEHRSRESDEQSREQFYRETLLEITDGKLRIVDRQDINDKMEPVTAVFLMDREDQLDDILRDVAGMGKDAGMHTEHTEEFLAALSEAAKNAVQYAGGGDISLGITEETIWACVDDYGQGIDTLILPTILLKSTVPANAEAASGYKLMLESVDAVYISSDQNGTTLLLEKSINPKAA